MTMSEQKDEPAKETLIASEVGTSTNNVENKTSQNSSIQSRNDTYDSTCGVLGCSPNWLQKLASKKSYVVAYGTLGMNQSAFSAYAIGTLSTIEKRFKLPSTTSGIISSAWDLGALGALLLMAYFGSAGHKTRWVAFGAFIAAFSCYLRYTPHFLYGSGDVLQYSLNTTSTNQNLCNDSNVIVENCSLNSEGMVTFLILVTAQIALGIGTSAYYTLGVAYLDDNSLKNKFPFLLAVSTFIRYMGPTLGFLLSSYTLSLYIDPNITPSFGQDDPRWIGAWYLGWVLFGSIEIVLASIMSLFPKILPREADRRITSGYQDNSKVTSMADFKQTLSRLLRNPVLMFNTFSSTFYIFGLMGYWIFMPKYIETQFRKTASSASLITGTVGLVCTAIGVMISGSVVSKFKPKPRYLAAWNVFTETVDVIGHTAFAFLGCLKDDLHGSYNLDRSWNATSECNLICNCDITIKYSPICSWDQSTTFYSPCHAGCTSHDFINGTKVFQNCSCIAGFGQATDGACPVECENNFYLFLALLCLMKFLSATGRAGNTIIQFRSVAPDDKSVAIAITEVVLCIFTFMPAPILFGWLLDSSCLIWGMTCGKTGNCWLYDGKKLRYLLNFTSSGFLLLGVLFDVGVFFNVGKLQLYDQSVKENEIDSVSINKEKKTLLNTLSSLFST